MCQIKSELLHGTQLLWTSVFFLLAVLQPVTFAVHLQDMDMVGQAIQQCAGQPLRSQHFGLFGERQIAGDERGGSLVPLAEDFE